MIMNILLREVLKGRTYPEAGDYMYGLIIKTLDSEVKYIWDFALVSEVPSLFLNMCLGRLIRERGADFVKSKISFKNITRSQTNRIIKYVEIMSQSK